MLIFSTIAAIILPIVYLLPLFIAWVLKDGKRIYRIRYKIIDYKKVFIIKIEIIIILSILFALTFPTKVMFYPVKVVIFIAIFILVKIITADSFILEIKEERSSREFVSLMLFVLLAAILIIGYNSTDKTFEGTDSTTKRYEVEYISSSGNVFMCTEGEELKVISITDENVKIEKSAEASSYVEKITTWRTYSTRYEKEKNTYYDESPCSVSYILYVVKSDLYK